MPKKTNKTSHVMDLLTNGSSQEANEPSVAAAPKNDASSHAAAPKKVTVVDEGSINDRVSQEILNKLSEELAGENQTASTQSGQPSDSEAALAADAPQSAQNADIPAQTAPADISSAPADMGQEQPVTASVNAEEEQPVMASANVEQPVTASANAGQGQPATASADTGQEQPAAASVNAGQEPAPANTQSANTPASQAATSVQTETPQAADTPVQAGAPQAATGPQAIIPKSQISSRFLNNEYHFVNVMEQLLLRQNMENYLDQYNVCKCARCMADVCALTLTGLPSKYVVTSKDSLSPLLSYYESKYKIYMLTEIIKACNRVRENPRHKKE